VGLKGAGFDFYMVSHPGTTPAKSAEAGL